jgi:hypothetical protein
MTEFGSGEISRKGAKLAKKVDGLVFFAGFAPLRERERRN